MPILDAIRSALAGPRAGELSPTASEHRPDPRPIAEHPPLDLGHVSSAPVREAVDDDRAWRSLSGGARELPDALRRDQLAAADQAWRSDPLANRIVELTSDLVLGNGVTIRAERPDVQAVVDAFWSHPLNRMQLRQFEWCAELTLTGELFVAFFTNPVDAQTYVRAIPAALVDQVETDPNDLERELRFHQQSTALSMSNAQPSTGEGRWWEAADMRHYAINRLLGATRGQGDLAPVLDWLRRYREWLTDRVRINRFKGAYLWDVTVQGADRHALIARQAELAAAPPPGSLLFHNEAEEWRAVAPNIDAADVAADGKAIRRLVAAGAGLPLHFLAEAEDGNRAVAREQARPTNLRFQRRQLVFGLILVDVCTEVVRRSGRVPGDQIGPLEPVFPDTEPTDNLQLSQAAVNAARAIQLAQREGWLAPPDAAALFHQFLGGIAAPTRGPASTRAPRRPPAAT
jgi:hypothetical protein